MITLAEIDAMPRANNKLTQRLWYEQQVDGEWVDVIFPETKAFLTDIVSQGLLFYMYGTHSRPHETTEVDFFLSASTVESLQAILAAAKMHKKLYGLYDAYTGDVRMWNRAQTHFIAPASNLDQM